MGNLHSMYTSYKSAYDELDSKYNKLHADNNANKTKINVLNDAIKKLENDLVKNRLSLDEEMDINNINKKKIDSLVASHESELINNENSMELLKAEFSNKETELRLLIEKNNKNVDEIVAFEKIVEELKTKITDLENNDRNNIKYLQIEKNKVKNCEHINREQKLKIEEYIKTMDELLDKINTSEEEKYLIKQNIRDIISYYYDNKDIVVQDILLQNNTLIPDSIEKNIIGNIYDCLLDKINRNLEN